MADKPYAIQSVVVRDSQTAFWRLVAQVRSRKDADDAARNLSVSTGIAHRVTLLPANLVLAVYNNGEVSK